MEVRIGEYLTKFCNDVFRKLNGIGISHVQHIGTDTACGPHFGGIAGVATEFWVCGKGCHEVTWHIHFRQDIDMAFCSIAHHVLHFLLCVVEWAVWAIGLSAFASPIHLSIFFNFGNGRVVAALALCSC